MAFLQTQQVQAVALLRPHTELAQVSAAPATQAQPTDGLNMSLADISAAVANSPAIQKLMALNAQA